MKPRFELLKSKVVLWAGKHPLYLSLVITIILVLAGLATGSPAHPGGG